MTRRTRRKVGIFDFTGNPITIGHLVPAASIAHDAGLDKVIFTVSRTPPNKRPEDVLDAESRYEFAVAATADNPKLGASRVNLRRHGVSYGLVTVEGYLEENPDDEVYYMLSGEYLNPVSEWWIKNWTGAKELFKLCKILIFPRYDQTVAELKELAKLVPDADIRIYEAASPPISATLVREETAAGRSIRYLVVPSTLAAVHKAGAFRSAASAPETHFDPYAPVKHVGIFLSEFDPITYGDLRAAEVARQDFGLDRVEFVPTLEPVDGRTLFAPAESRYEMVATAVADNDYFRISRCDYDRGTKSYGLLSLHDMRVKYGKDTKFSVMCYADNLVPGSASFIGEWMGSKELFTLARLIVIPTLAVSYERALELAKNLPFVDVVNSPAFPIDAAGIRERVQAGRCVSYNLPRAVEQQILNGGFYTKPKGSRTKSGARKPVTKSGGSAKPRARRA